MERKYNLWSLFLCCLSLILTLHSMYASINQTWSIAPSPSILLIVSASSFVLAVKGFKDNRNGLTRLRSWLTVILALILSVVLFLGVLIHTFTRDLINTSQSPDDKYTVDFYTVNGGATTSISALGVLDGPLWFKKDIYRDNNMHKADVDWSNNHTISINNHSLNLNKGDTFKD